MNNLNIIFDKIKKQVKNKRELDTESIINNFISHVRFDTKLLYNDFEIYEAIENMFELYQYYKMKGNN